MLFFPSEMANDKLTMQALIEHDRVQPKFKAPKGTGTSTSSAVKEVSHINKDIRSIECYDLWSVI